MDFGDRVREARIRAGLTQLQLAVRAGISIGTVSNIERGADIATADLTRYKIHKALADYLDGQAEVRS